PRHQTGTRWRADGGRRVEVRQLDAILGKLVEIGRAYGRVSKTTQVAIAEIIAEKNDDVGLLRGVGGLAGEAAKRCEDKKAADPAMAVHVVSTPKRGAGCHAHGFACACSSSSMILPTGAAPTALRGHAVPQARSFRVPVGDPCRGKACPRKAVG